MWLDTINLSSKDISKFCFSSLTKDEKHDTSIAASLIQLENGCSLIADFMNLALSSKLRWIYLLFILKANF